jgi:2-phospho-L-lactate guanylyltransferase
MNIWLIIPVNSLKESKSRLANVLTEDQRRELTCKLLLQLIEVSRQVSQIHRILIVTPDPEVESLVSPHDAITLLESGKQGLNGALAESRDYAAAAADCILILPSDLPFITRLDIEMLLAPLSNLDSSSISGGPGQNGPLMVICPDQRGGGTNALLLCEPKDFTFNYGPDSFQKHLEEASHRGLKIYRVEPDGVKFDLDSEEDWREFVKRTSTVPFAGIFD